MRTMLGVLFGMVCTAGWCQPAPQAEAPVRLENAAIRVEIDAAEGRFRVLDKRCGYLWQGPGGKPVQPPELAVPRASGAPDATTLGANRAAGSVAVTLSPDMVADAKRVDGPADLSAQVNLAWDDRGLSLRVDVRDDKLVFPAADEAQWWEKDSVEFWVNDRQYAVRFGPWGVNAWASGGDTEGIVTGYQPREGGYQITVLVPTRLMGEAGKVGVGGRLRFAIGVNDCDGPPGREGQLYYPTTWVHSDPGTFASATLADASGKVPAQTQAPARSLEPAPGGDNRERTFRTRSLRGAPGLAARMTFRLDGERPDLLLSVETDDPNAKVGAFALPHPLVLDRTGGRILGAQYCDGIGVPTDDLAWAGREWNTFGTLDMPWVGLTDGTIGYLLLWELPVSCDNGAARFERVQVGDRRLLAPAAYHHPIKGRFGPARTVRYSFAAAGGHVALCKRYRDYARDNGFLVTQAEKLKRKPELAKLAGAPDMWGRNDLEFCRQAKAEGIDRMLINGPSSREDMEAIRKLGYLISVYDNYEDAYEGDAGGYGDFKTARDALILGNGKPMTAWLTHDTPPKQFMKRCTALFADVARRWIPKDLAAHPYNARFLDVTTACGYAECFSETHPLDRSSDRQARRRLAQYVGDELGLVLGGEHGRWFGADIYNYWEGMQSGGFYSWPAGYVGEALPKTREEIGKEYLEWGLGEKNRYPLWELVFHDCVVSTWYWGDSTGHLRQVAPELGYKQDAYNVLYGTVPLFWNNTTYSYDWSKPDLRRRLLESYRNTCKLHEQIGFQEMVSHEFVTGDRAVQKTVFGGGTEVWVNFGAEPWTLDHGGKKWVLPQYGFYAKGPTIEQYRVVQRRDEKDYKGLDEQARAGGGLPTGADRVVTCVRTPDYLYVKGDVPGLVESCEGSEVTIRREGPGRIRLNTGASAWVRIAPRTLGEEAGAGTWLAIGAESPDAPSGTPFRVGVYDGMLRLPAMPQPGCLLFAPGQVAQMTELAISDVSGLLPEKPAQGDTLACTVTVANLGGREAKGVTVALYATKVAPALRLASAKVSVPTDATVQVPFTIPTARYDGPTSLIFRADDTNAIQEVCKTDNEARRSVAIRPEWDLWDSHVDVTMEAGPIARDSSDVAELLFDADAERARLGKAGKADPAAIRVVRLDQAGAPADRLTCQYVDGAPAERKLVWRLPDGAGIKAGETAKCRIYIDGLENARHETAGAGRWDPQRQEVLAEGSGYRATFRDGYIRKLTLGQQHEVIANLGVSSQDTGWVDENGKVDSFEVLHDGPLFTQVRVRKTLTGGHSYDKLYSFYPRHFLVTTLSPERFGVLNRAYYTQSCTYSDDKGNQATIDGQGNEENVMGKAPGAKWFVTTDKQTWTLSCLAQTPADNICYWDCAGAMGGLGFTHAGSEPATVAYVVHLGVPPANKQGEAPQDYARLTQPMAVPR